MGQRLTDDTVSAAATIDTLWVAALTADLEVDEERSRTFVLPEARD